MAQKERGLSMTGFLFTTVVVITVALIAFRVGPSYIEYFTVQKALDQTMLEVQNPTIAEIKRSMDRRQRRAARQRGSKRPGTARLADRLGRLMPCARK